MYMHLKKVLHRDIKPMNLLVFGDPHDEDDQYIKISDLGLGKNFESGSNVNSIKGTLGFMAPELVAKYVNADNHTQYNETVDVWSLCVSFYWLSTLSNHKANEFIMAADFDEDLEFPEMPDHLSNHWKETLILGI
jgi:serine/threonine protein kinase